MSDLRNMSLASWNSKVRGLVLGLALGDAIGSQSCDLRPSGPLEAGTATQLAAWTIEGMLRTATRFAGDIYAHPPDPVRHAYQRWALLRGGRSTADNWNPLAGGDLARGWLIDVPAMAEVRGNSPGTLSAILKGEASNSHGCQGMLRALPAAALIGQVVPWSIEEQHAKVSHYARGLAAITHGGCTGETGLAVHIAARCLIEDQPLAVIGSTLQSSTENTIPQAVLDAVRLGQSEPCVPQIIEKLAPDRTAVSALAGGLYVAMSFPYRDTVEDAIEFASWAPDGDSVAGVAGAFLGAHFGYEAFPTALLSRLELGWALDRLAIDLARQMDEVDATVGDDFWWAIKYPPA